MFRRNPRRRQEPLPLFIYLTPDCIKILAPGETGKNNKRKEIRSHGLYPSQVYVPIMKQPSGDIISFLM